MLPIYLVFIHSDLFAKCFVCMFTTLSRHLSRFLLCPGRNVDETILWDFPSIRILAKTGHGGPCL